MFHRRFLTGLEAQHTRGDKTYRAVINTCHGDCFPGPPTPARYPASHPPPRSTPANDALPR
ncbi:hypothetical protein E2C01_040020 [Portunus trituberculatus]|uniref:Uncharacterized protein n=1 Tax=Portunus trituberculatus TaxID=210409 RepID=A0A5B7FPK6_PORTR|nr:hypothetical protein [Portunus trituberculatus]